MRAIHCLPAFRSIVALSAITLLAGCATKFDYSGNPVYFLQFGQQWDNAVDYSNPRLPILPRGRPVEPLWNLPNPYEFNDLSHFSQLRNPLPETLIASVGDNAGCAAASCASNASGWRLVARADLRDAGRQSVIR
ncbi:MAG: hypothetical protein ABIO63_08385 [Casimicrobiaceae bacterium]